MIQQNLLQLWSITIYHKELYMFQLFSKRSFTPKERYKILQFSVSIEGHSKVRPLSELLSAFLVLMHLKIRCIIFHHAVDVISTDNNMEGIVTIMHSMEPMMAGTKVACLVREGGTRIIKDKIHNQIRITNRIITKDLETNQEVTNSNKMAIKTKISKE